MKIARYRQTAGNRFTVSLGDRRKTSPYLGAALSAAQAFACDADGPCEVLVKDETIGTPTAVYRVTRNEDGVVLTETL
jgi:hypothetical protein